MLKSTSVLCAALVVLACTTSVAAQQVPAAAASESIKRTPLQRFDVPGTGYETVIGIAEIAQILLSGGTRILGPNQGILSRAALSS